MSDYGSSGSSSKITSMTTVNIQSVEKVDISVSIICGVLLFEYLLFKYL